ncbi:MAG: hypothetical protein GY850_45815, partial [bacterium]|nr:hypothetical protein [bacterium]
MAEDDRRLFDELPTIDAATGKLRFTPKAGANGIASVTVQLVDGGGTLHGG